MKISLKKYIYLLNDLTNLALKKDREEWHAKYDQLLKFFSIAVALLIISLSLNIYHYVSR